MKEESSTKCGIDISPRGIERILVAGKTAEDHAETYRLLAQVAPELRRLDLALKGQAESATLRTKGIDAGTF